MLLLENDLLAVLPDLCKFGTRSLEHVVDRGRQQLLLVVLAPLQFFHGLLVVLPAVLHLLLLKQLALQQRLRARLQFDLQPLLKLLLLLLQLPLQVALDIKVPVFEVFRELVLLQNLLPVFLN